MSRMAASVLILLLLGACVAVPPGGLTGATVGPPEGVTYLLPFEKGTRRLCVQGGPGLFSHSGTQRYAIDFTMPEGTEVLASRGGRVIGVKEDSDQGGPSRKFAKHGNYVRVLHEDGTVAVYLHLKLHGAAVEVGQVVRRGEVLGHSGKTGWSAMEHLHFQVDARDPETGSWTSIPVRFDDVRGRGVPRMLIRYESDNERADR